MLQSMRKVGLRAERLASEQTGSPPRDPSLKSSVSDHTTTTTTTTTTTKIPLQRKPESEAGDRLAECKLADDDPFRNKSKLDFEVKSRATHRGRVRSRELEQPPVRQPPPPAEEIVVVVLEEGVVAPLTPNNEENSRLYVGVPLFRSAENNGISTGEGDDEVGSSRGDS